MIVSRSNITQQTRERPFQTPWQVIKQWCPKPKLCVFKMGFSFENSIDIQLFFKSTSEGQMTAWFLKKQKCDNYFPFSTQVQMDALAVISHYIVNYHNRYTERRQREKSKRNCV